MRMARPRQNHRPQNIYIDNFQCKIVRYWNSLFDGAIKTLSTPIKLRYDLHDHRPSGFPELNFGRFAVGDSTRSKAEAPIMQAAGMRSEMLRCAPR